LNKRFFEVLYGIMQVLLFQTEAQILDVVCLLLFDEMIDSVQELKGFTLRIGK
jgi:hypothetical protein